MSNRPELPRTDSISELAEFWDTHDLTDFEDRLEEISDRVFTRRVGTYTFTLILDAGPLDDQAERLHAILNDGTLATVAGVPRIHVHREAASLVDAIRAAIADVRRAGLDVIRVEIAPDAVQQAS